MSRPTYKLDAGDDPIYGPIETHHDPIANAVEMLLVVLDEVHLFLFSLGYKWRSKRLIALSAQIPGRQA